VTGNRDHGGDLGLAIATHGGFETDWIDLSTGINRAPYPFDNISELAFRSLPRSHSNARLLAAAAQAYATDWPLLTLAGAQAAIQLLPHLMAPKTTRILGPTYNEFESAFKATGWQVENVLHAQDLSGADIAVMVNPNNPTGTVFDPMSVLKLARNVGLLVVDESFADPTPETSVLTQLMPDNVVVLRSFGKFFGLAGLRLGFAAAPPELLTRLATAAGPWSVSGPALEIGAIALGDAQWQSETRDRLAQDVARCDRIASGVNWTPIGGTALFRLYETTDALAAQTQLAQHNIWSRIFPYSKSWLRLGLPGSEDEWHRLEAALKNP